MVIQKIVISQKSRLLREKNNIYSFFVLPQLNKFQIKKRLEVIFPGIKIKKVRTCLYKPVLRSVNQIRRLPGKQYTKLRKKAFVELLPESNVISIFEKNKIAN